MRRICTAFGSRVLVARVEASRLFVGGWEVPEPQVASIVEPHAVRPVGPFQIVAPGVDGDHPTLATAVDDGTAAVHGVPASTRRLVSDATLWRTAMNASRSISFRRCSTTVKNAAPSTRSRMRASSS